MTAGRERWEALARAQSARVAASDPLLDPRAATRPAPPEEEVRVLADAREVVLGLARHTAARSVWTAPWSHVLALARVDGLPGDEVARAVGEVLDRWEAEVLAPSSSAWEEDTSAVVSLPARDDAPVAALVARHFSRSAVLAVRRVGARDGGPGAGAVPDGSVVREAGVDDVAAVVAASVATHRADQLFGFVPAVPDLEERLSDGVAEALAGSPGWTWLAERDGEVLGVCRVEPPAEAGWIASSVTAAPAAYLGVLHVEPGVRGAGVGRRLVAAAHARCAREGVAAVLLHHAAASPRSAPFWAREGYRPLLTTWSRRPAVRAPARPRGPGSAT